MKFLRLLASMILVPIVLVGCSSNGGGGVLGHKDLTYCVIGGAAAGGAAGGIFGDGGGAVMGILAGAVAGQLFCLDDMMAPQDSDGDGVSDAMDQCPGTPAGAPVDSKGCPLYSDGDGVPDYLDKCPGTPSGVKVDPDGCPLDSDGDGVQDYLDKCPATPAGSIVDADGCPPPGETLAIVTSINFDFDSSKIRSDSAQKLDRIVGILNSNSGVRTRVEGYTDSTGPEKYNEGLSFRRANAVKDYLISKGIANNRLSVVGFGEKNPLVTNKSRAGRAVNRRVEFKVL